MSPFTQYAAKRQQKKELIKLVKQRKEAYQGATKATDRDITLRTSERLKQAEIENISVQARYWCDIKDGE